MAGAPAPSQEKILSRGTANMATRSATAARNPFLRSRPARRRSCSIARPRAARSRWGWYWKWIRPGYDHAFPEAFRRTSLVAIIDRKRSWGARKSAPAPCPPRPPRPTWQCRRTIPLVYPPTPTGTSPCRRGTRTAEQVPYRNAESPIIIRGFRRTLPAGRSFRRTIRSCVPLRGRAAPRSPLRSSP